MENFYNTAVMLIYPDGTIINKSIDKDVLHKYYYEKIFDEDSNFRNIIKSKNEITEEMSFEFNKLLTDMGIVVINNINIYNIIYNKNYLEGNIPNFVFNLPEKLTEQQRKILLNLFNEYSLYGSLYGIPKEKNYDEINFYELYGELEQKIR